MNYKHKAFISYRHGGEDEILAKKLHSGIEHYRIPAKLCRMFRHLPKRIRPIYRDNTDLGIDGLHALFLEALRESEYLVVVCSERAVTPNAEGKLWVDEEVRQFIAANPNENFRKIIPVFVGEEKDYKRFLLPVLRELETPEGAKALGITLPEICESGYEIIGISAKTSGVPRLINDVSAAILKLRPDDLWQRHRREQKRRLLTYLCGGFLALAAACFGYWDYYMPHAYFYSDYVEINHIPQGIGGELMQDEIRIRNFHYKITKRKHKVQKLEMLNSAGRPVRSVDADLFPPGQLRPVQIFFDSYDDDGNLVKSRRKYDAYSAETEEWSYQNAGTSVTIRKAGTDGGAFAVLKKSSVGNAARTQVAGYRYKRDEVGRIETVFFCDLTGIVTRDELGSVGLQLSYDENDHVAETRFWVLSESGELVKGPRLDGVASIKSDYDEVGNLTSVVYEDATGKPILSQSGYAMMQQEYDQYNCTKRSYYDERFKPCFHKKGRSVLRIKYDSRGNAIEWSNFDDKGNLCLEQNCYAIQRCRYDLRGSRVERSYYDELGRPCFHRNGHSILQMKYDSRGSLIERASYDKNENLCLNKSGRAVERFFYDEKGKCIRAEYYGKDGKTLIGSKVFE